MTTPRELANVTAFANDYPYVSEIARGDLSKWVAALASMRRTKDELRSEPARVAKQSRASLT